MRHESTFHLEPQCLEGQFLKQSSLLLRMLVKSITVFNLQGPKVLDHLNLAFFINILDSSLISILWGARCNQMADPAIKTYPKPS